jgi:tetratricopeptide (TPR) repeat protein
MNSSRKYKMNFIGILLTYLIVLFNIGTLYSQDTEYADSLFIDLSNSNSSEEKISILILLKDFYEDNDFEKAIQYARSAIIEAENSGLLNREAEAYSIIGELLESEDEYIEAIENYVTSYEIYKTLGDEKGIARLSYDLANIYKKKGFYQQSMEKCLEGLELFESLNDSSGQASVYNCMGSLYKYQDNNARALEYYNRSLEIRKALKDTSGISLCYNNIGVVYYREGSIELSLDFYKRALELSIQLGDIKNQAIHYNNLANSYLTNNEFDKAFQYITISLELYNSVGYTRGVANQTQSLGRYYSLTGDMELAVESYLQAYELYKELGRLEYEKNITAILSETYYKKGDFKNAHSFLSLNKAFSDSLFNLEKMKNIASLEFEFKQLRENEIRDLREQRRIAINLIIGLSLCFSLVIAILLFSRQKIKINEQKLSLHNIELEKKQIETELQLKEKELAAGTIIRVRKNEVINDIISRLYDSIKNLKDENVPIIKNIISDLKNSEDEHIWDEFEVRFLKVHQNFYDNMGKQYPELTTNEKRLSAFLRLDFSTKEISSITNQTAHSINIARTRLRKKLGLANSDTSLTQFLSQF